jgi:hypothetical protein
MTSDLSIRILPSESPLDGSLLGVSGVLPSFAFGLQKCPTDNASIQALPAEDVNFDLGDVRPTRAIGHHDYVFCGVALGNFGDELLHAFGVDVGSISGSNFPYPCAIQRRRRRCTDE